MSCQLFTRRVQQCLEILAFLAKFALQGARACTGFVGNDINCCVATGKKFQQRRSRPFSDSSRLIQFRESPAQVRLEDLPHLFVGNQKWQSGVFSLERHCRTLAFPDCHTEIPGIGIRGFGDLPRSYLQWRNPCSRRNACELHEERQFSRNEGRRRINSRVEPLEFRC